MIQRKLGQTEQQLSVVGFGGIVVTDTTPEEARRYVSEAVDLGVNYFDVAPGYGNAEERLGPALQPYRDRIFLACKTGQREKAGSRAELEQSLKRLCTDHLDLYQLHGITSVEEVQTALGPGGALETFLEARQEGKVKYLGFSAHSEAAALAAMRGFQFDSLLMPFNFVTYTHGFGASVMEEAKQRGIGRLALKAMAYSPIEPGTKKSFEKCWYHPISDPRLADLALRFTLSLPITSAIPPGHWELFRMAVEIANRLTPITEGERQELVEIARGLTPIFAVPNGIATP